MATLRNTALSRLRATAAANMTEAVRDLSYEPFTIPLGIPPLTSGNVRGIRFCKNPGSKKQQVTAV
ncbi:hypothetical protein ACWCYZ_33055 [Streptomyces virginiae]